MKKLLLAAAFATFAFGASAQTATLPVTLTADDLNRIAAMLGQLPYSSVVPIFQLLSQREQEAQAAAHTPKTENLPYSK